MLGIRLKDSHMLSIYITNELEPYPTPCHSLSLFSLFHSPTHLILMPPHKRLYFLHNCSLSFFLRRNTNLNQSKGMQICVCNTSQIMFASVSIPLKLGQKSKASRRDSPVIISVGELSLTPTSWDIQESRQCTFPVQHNKANTVSSGVGEPAPKLWVWEHCPHYPSFLGWHGGWRATLLPSHPPINAWGR